MIAVNDLHSNKLRKIALEQWRIIPATVNRNHSQQISMR